MPVTGGRRDGAIVTSITSGREKQHQELLPFCFPILQVVERGESRQENLQQQRSSCAMSGFRFCSNTAKIVIQVPTSYLKVLMEMGIP